MKTEVVKYTTNEAEIAKMSAIYMELTVKGLDDTEGLEAVHSARMTIVKHRTGIDKLRKATNADAQTFIKTNNANAKKLLELMAPIEEHLKTEEEKITKEKERIKAEEERLEKIKTDGRVTSLFTVGVNIPYLEAAMLSDEEYTAWLDIATNDYNTERLRLQEEQKTSDEAAAKLAADQAEIARIQKEQEDKAEAQAEAEKAIEIKLKAIEDEKKAAIERLEREEFEKKAIEKAIIQAKKDAAEAEKIRVSKEKAYLKAKELRLKTARLDVLEKIGFKYKFNDLGIMPDKQYTELYKKHQAVWDIEQKALLVKKIEQERKEKEKAEAAEMAWLEAFKPDKELLLDFANRIIEIKHPVFENIQCQNIADNARVELLRISNNVIKQVKEV